MALVVLVRGRRRPLYQTLMEERARFYHSELVLWIWTWCALGRTRGDSPKVCGFGKPGPSLRLTVVAPNPWTTSVFA